LKLINFITQFLLIFGKLGFGDLLHLHLALEILAFRQKLFILFLLTMLLLGKLGIGDLLVFDLDLEIFAFGQKLLILAIQTIIPTLLSFQGFLNLESCVDECYISALKLCYPGRLSLNLFTLVNSFI
jgi:hypothetical protein